MFARQVVFSFRAADTRDFAGAIGNAMNQGLALPEMFRWLVGHGFKHTLHSLVCPSRDPNCLSHNYWSHLVRSRSCQRGAFFAAQYACRPFSLCCMLLRLQEICSKASDYKFLLSAHTQKQIEDGIDRYMRFLKHNAFH